MNKRYKELFDSIKNTIPEKLDSNSRILIVDGLNTFIRSFTAINHVNPLGVHTGGLTGFLKSIGYVIKLVQPTRVIIVFDGIGSSSTKKNLYPDYKANRNLSRITNWEIYDSKEEESEAMSSQLIRLVGYLKELPVTLLSIDKIEADDVIGFICSHFKKNKNFEKITIMSSDKDFLQLSNEKIDIYSPTKKKFYTPNEVYSEYGVSPINIPIYKSILGDKSDNIPGVKGIGPKKIIKLFPEAGHTDIITSKDAINIAKNNRESNLLYENIMLFEKQLHINYQLVNLLEQNISDRVQNEIIDIIEQPCPKLNITKFLLMYDKDVLGNDIPNTSTWLTQIFGSLNYFH
jgi:5'-3' exonuclease